MNREQRKSKKVIKKRNNRQGRLLRFKQSQRISLKSWWQKNYKE